MKTLIKVQLLISIVFMNLVLLAQPDRIIWDNDDTWFIDAASNKTDRYIEVYNQDIYTKCRISILGYEKNAPVTNLPLGDNPRVDMASNGNSVIGYFNAGNYKIYTLDAVGNIISGPITVCAYDLVPPDSDPQNIIPLINNYNVFVLKEMDVPYNPNIINLQIYKYDLANMSSPPLTLNFTINLSTYFSSIADYSFAGGNIVYEDLALADVNNSGEFAIAYKSSFYSPKTDVYRQLFTFKLDNAANLLGMIDIFDFKKKTGEVRPSVNLKHDFTIEFFESNDHNNEYYLSYIDNHLMQVECKTDSAIDPSDLWDKDNCFAKLAPSDIKLRYYDQNGDLLQEETYLPFGDNPNLNINKLGTSTVNVQSFPDKIQFVAMASQANPVYQLYNTHFISDYDISDTIGEIIDLKTDIYYKNDNPNGIFGQVDPSIPDYACISLTPCFMRSINQRFEADYYSTLRYFAKTEASQTYDMEGDVHITSDIIGQDLKIDGNLYLDENLVIDKSIFRFSSTGRMIIAPNRTVNAYNSIFTNYDYYCPGMWNGIQLDTMAQFELSKVSGTGGYESEISYAHCGIKNGRNVYNRLHESPRWEEAIYRGRGIWLNGVKINDNYIGVFTSDNKSVFGQTYINKCNFETNSEIKDNARYNHGAFMNTYCVFNNSINIKVDQNCSFTNNSTLPYYDYSSNGDCYTSVNSGSAIQAMSSNIIVKNAQFENLNTAINTNDYNLARSKILIQNNNFHNNANSIIDYGSSDLRVYDNYFENDASFGGNTHYAMGIRGSVNYDIEDNMSVGNYPLNAFGLAVLNTKGSYPQKAQILTNVLDNNSTNNSLWGKNKNLQLHCNVMYSEGKTKRHWWHASLMDDQYNSAVPGGAAGNRFIGNTSEDELTISATSGLYTPYSFKYYHNAPNADYSLDVLDLSTYNPTPSVVITNVNTGTLLDNDNLGDCAAAPNFWEPEQELEYEGVPEWGPEPGTPQPHERRAWENDLDSINGYVAMNDFTKIIPYLTACDSPWCKLWLTHEYIGKEDYGNAQSSLNGIPQSYFFMQDDRTYLQTLISLGMQGKKLNELNGFEKQWMENYALSEGEYAQEAQAILHFYYGHDYPWPQIPDYSNARLHRPQSETEEATKPNMPLQTRLYPNPAQDYFVLASKQTGHLVVYDLLGNIALEQDISEFLTDINTEKLNAGMYQAILMNHNNEIIFKDKIFIER